MIPEAPLPVSLLFKHSSLEGPNFTIPQDIFPFHQFCLKTEFSWIPSLISPYPHWLRPRFEAIHFNPALLYCLVVNPFSIDANFASHSLLLAIVWGSKWLLPYNYCEYPPRPDQSCFSFVVISSTSSSTLQCMFHIISVIRSILMNGSISANVFITTIVLCTGWIGIVLFQFEIPT